jgi:alkanesulfonate monooxygenase SsuD/methylene tetrahydromethanopterin reductase-like flavin-dependent oxidoreductase (luciferase family)
MRTGVVLPTFTESAEDAFEVARRAEALGVDGVFCYDHLWPMGRPDRPALAPFPVLGALAARTGRITLGTLVARIGLAPNEVIVAEFDALSLLAPDRVIAVLGTGDHLSAAENQAYGIPFAPAAERRGQLAACARALRDRGLPVWIGGGAAKTVAIAEEERVAVNLWAAGPEAVALQAARSEVTWAGPCPLAAGADPASPAGPPDPGALEALVAQLAAAGASWAVFAWPVPMEVLVAAAGDPGPARPG